MNKKRWLGFLKSKKLWMLSLVFFLSGCTGDIGYEYQKGGITNLHKSIPAYFRDISYNIDAGLNNIFYGIRASALKAAEGNIEQVWASLSSIEVLPSVITAISLIGLGIIVVRFSWIVFKNYFASFGEGEQVITFNLIKKFIYASVFVYLAPFIIINGFLFTTLLAGQTVAFLNFNMPVGESNYVDINKDLSIGQITLSTYCYQEDHPLPKHPSHGQLVLLDRILNKVNFAGIFTKEDIENTLTSSDAKIYSSLKEYTFIYLIPSSAGDNGNTGAYMDKLYRRYCSPYIIGNEQFYPRSVMEAVTYNTNLKDETTVRINGVNQTRFTSRLLYEGGGVGVLGIKALSILLIGVFSLVTWYATVVRIGELLISIIATPFFAMNYISNERSSTMATWVQELSSIFLTHIVTVIAFFMGMVEMAKTWNNSTFLIVGGLIIVMVKGPQIIRNWTSSTGAGGAAGSVARGAVGFGRSMMR